MALHLLQVLPAKPAHKRRDLRAGARRGCAMGRFTLSAIVGAALLVIPSAASFAADIPDTPYFPPPPVQIGGGWYLKGHIGLAAQHFKGLEHPLFEAPEFFEFLDPGHFAGVPTFGVGIGYQHS